MDPRFDDLLHTIITEKGQGVYGFLDVMLGFLYRRTDYFYEMAPGENMGFFPSQAEALVSPLNKCFSFIITSKNIKNFITKKEFQKGILIQKRLKSI